MNEKGSIIFWLTNILEERFGIDFKLAENVGHIIIHINNSNKKIILPPLWEVFINVEKEMPMSWWDAEAEGWSSVLGKHLPMPGVERNCSKELIIKDNNDCYTIEYDVLGLIYWSLTRKEETLEHKSDLHDRFSGKLSHAYKNGYIERPYVDEWLCIIYQVIQRLCPDIELKTHTFNVQLSHDVDRPTYYGFKSTLRITRIIGSLILKKRNFNLALNALIVWSNTRNELHSKDPANTFDWIMTCSEKNNLKSAFYFICGNTDETKDSDYVVEHPAIRKLIREISARGHEIGLHPSYNSYKDDKQIHREALRLRSLCKSEGIYQEKWGGRMHYLRWEQPTTLYALLNAGMTYDNTMGYADTPGFRCGTCFEFPAFDPVKNTKLNFRVRPLICMDCSITSEDYLGLGEGELAYKKMSELKEACRLVNGSFTLLWHNSSLLTEESRNLYASIISNSRKI